MNFSFWLGQKEYRLGLEEKGKNVFTITIGEKKHLVGVEFINKEELLLNIDGEIFNVVISSNSLSHSVYVNGRLFKLEKQTALKILKEERGKARKKDVKITMPGRVVEVLASEGEEVAEGQPVLVLEAMKMQNEIKAPQIGIIGKVNFKAGDYVEAGSVLFSIE